jgi:spoIIIJ-associated protein
VAHAEASARTVDAAVTAAAAQLGLRSDQVDVEVLEEPVPSTFGYIGSPARVRVTPRATASSIGAEPGGASPASGPRAAGIGSSGAEPGGGEGSVGEGSGVGGSAGGGSGVGAGSSGGGSGPERAGTELHPTAHPSAQEQSTEAIVADDPAPSMQASPTSPPSVLAHPSATVTEAGNGQVPADHSAQPGDQLAIQTEESSASSGDQLAVQTEESSVSSQESSGSSESVTESATGLVSSDPSATVDVSASDTSAAPGASGRDVATSAASAAPPTSATSVSPSPAASAPATLPAVVPEAASSPSSPSSPSVPEAASTSSTAGAPPSAIAPEAPRQEEPGSSTRGTRPPRRTYKDEPIEPQMVEEDTERAGDFLEGLLDALDIDGDITTWVDEVGGHIDLEGADLDDLVGPNGETLDALQELTRLAVLRQSKRRVRLLIDINGFRARQREQLTSMVRATVEQVIRTHEDHELQPMSPAERKIVHDAVAAIEGARTESLGEEPNRRVVIRPA